jgi:hypothetical protein
MAMKMKTVLKNMFFGVVSPLRSAKIQSFGKIYSLNTEELIKAKQKKVQ